MLKAKGTIKVEPEQSRIVVEMANDIVDYYNYFITKKYWIKLQKPLHNAHITIATKKYHKDVNWQRAAYYNGEQIEFEYDPYLVQGGHTKGFIMFYLKVYSEEIDNMKRELNIIENDKWRGTHLTIGSSGKSGSKHVSYWPELITVKN